jgi:hypothetical protein
MTRRKNHFVFVSYDGHCCQLQREKCKKHHHHYEQEDELFVVIVVYSFAGSSVAGCTVSWRNNVMDVSKKVESVRSQLAQDSPILKLPTS